MAKGKYEYWQSTDGLLLLSAWARDGLIDEQIAKNMDISIATLYRWKQRYRNICEALKKNKAIADIQVENALYKLALGYEYTEVIEENKGEDGKLIVTKKVTKQVAPNTTAQMLWLKNRKPSEWRDKRDGDNQDDKVVQIIDDI